MNKINYFLYARKSSENEDKQVASIPSQIEELKILAQQHNLNIVDILTEEKSAKAPGRPVFNVMLEKIHKGEAQGIVCWKLDRLARNPIDGGNISWMLQQGLICHIQTFQRSYYPTDNVLMMNLEFGMANQFILDLSVNTKRGQRQKIQEGWLPHKPPMGYINNTYNLPDKPPIFRDEKNFNLIKCLWEILIEQGLSVDKIAMRATDMGLRTGQGRPLSRSKFYAMFKNPFYYGKISWNGEIYQGRHEPMISKEQFDLAQEIIQNKAKPKGQTRKFTYRGLMRCGECGAMITAEKKTKKQKNGNVHHYTYYRCTKRVRPKCTQKTIRENVLETQVMNVLGKINIPKEFHEWAIKHLQEEHEKEQRDRNAVLKSQQASLDDCIDKLDVIFNMRLSGELTSDEYKIRKKELYVKKSKFEELLADTQNRVETWLNTADELFSFAAMAQKRFESGDESTKREVLSCLGSNLTLKDRMLSINLNPVLGIVGKIAPEIRELHIRLEPEKGVINQEVLEDYYSKNEKWGRLLDDVRTCLLSCSTV